MQSIPPLFLSHVFLRFITKKKHHYTPSLKLTASLPPEKKAENGPQKKERLRLHLPTKKIRLFLAVSFRTHRFFPTIIEWDLTNGPLSKLLELSDIYSGLGVRSVGPVEDFLDFFFSVHRLPTCDATPLGVFGDATLELHGAFLVFL